MQELHHRWRHWRFPRRPLPPHRALFRPRCLRKPRPRLRLRRCHTPYIPEHPVESRCSLRIFPRSRDVKRAGGRNYVPECGEILQEKFITIYSTYRTCYHQLLSDYMAPEKRRSSHHNCCALKVLTSNNLHLFQTPHSNSLFISNRQISIFQNMAGISHIRLGRVAGDVI